MDVPALIAGIVVILALGMGGLLALRFQALIELRRVARAQAATNDPETAKRRRRRMMLMLSAVGAFYVVAGLLFLFGRAVSGPRLAAGLVAAWLIVAIGVGFSVAIWWDIRHSRL